MYVHSMHAYMCVYVMWKHVHVYACGGQELVCIFLSLSLPHILRQGLLPLGLRAHGSSRPPEHCNCRWATTPARHSCEC